MKMLKKNFWELKNNLKERPLNFILRTLLGLLFAFGIFSLGFYAGLKFKKYSESLRLIVPNLYKNGIVWIFNYGFTVLFPFTILSSSISNISIFFKDKSLKLFLTLPIDDLNFFLNRIFKAFLISNGYIYFLVIPFIFGMSNLNTSIISFLPLSIYLSLSFFLSLILTFLLSYFFNVSYLYKFFSFSFAILTVFILVLFRASMPDTFFSNPYLFFLQFQEPKSFFYSIFSPLSFSFYNLTVLEKFEISFYYIFSSLFLFFLSFFIFKKIYHKSFTKSLSSKEGKIGIKKAKIFQKSIILNIVIKEWLSVIRTPLRLTQSALMLSLIVFYFFNFQIVPLKEEPMMINVYKGLHIFLLSFILSALGLRFSFPSVSLEGKSFYIFKILPISYKRYLFSKGISYFLPFVILSIILNIGAFFNIPFSFYEKVFFLLYGFSFSIITSFFAVYFGSMNPQFNNSNPLQIGFSAEGLFYFFICFLLSIIFTIYYLKDLLELFL
jgi:ABC-2 type transport system permease protein